MKHHCIWTSVVALSVALGLPGCAEDAVPSPAATATASQATGAAVDAAGNGYGKLDAAMFALP